MSCWHLCAAARSSFCDQTCLALVGPRFIVGRGDFMAVTIRDNLSPIVQEPTGPVVRNEVGHPSFTLTMDGKTVQAYEGQTLLSVAIDNGITDIPNLCDDEKLEPTSACRMCLVHIEGEPRPQV